MSTRAAEVRFEIHLNDQTLAQQLRQDVRACFAGSMQLPPRWFYDERGCELFDRITELPEYYPTRCEREILTSRADEIARATGASELLELGSGSSEKTHALLSAFARAGTLSRYVPFDVSHSYLSSAAPTIAQSYNIDVHAIVGDFAHHIPTLPIHSGTMVAFLGSTIGNLDTLERKLLLAELSAAADHGSWLLLGIDLVKDPARLIAAYDDSQGVTAEFNRNLIRVLNRELGTGLEEEAFQHSARWNTDEERMEMWLEVTRPQVAILDGLPIELPGGSEIRTELSCKFRPENIENELREASFEARHWWTDSGSNVALVLAQRR